MILWKKKKFLTFLGERDLILSSELSPALWTVNTWACLLESGVRSLMFMARCMTTTFSPHSLSPSRGGLLCQGWIYLDHWFLCWFRADFKTLSFPQPKKGLQGFLDCSLENPVPRINAFQHLSSLLLFWILPRGLFFSGNLWADFWFNVFSNISWVQMIFLVNSKISLKYTGWLLGIKFCIYDFGLTETWSRL